MNMHKEILSQEQVELLPLIQEFSQNFFLVGGTAIAFHLGHRRSIDFDLFSFQTFDTDRVRNEIKRNWGQIDRVLRDETGQFTILINTVHITFFEYPFRIDVTEKLDGTVRLPDLLTLAAMKAHALGRRAKWKDYVDCYFILKHYSIAEISQKAKQYYNHEFNERIFREQLNYFTDIDYHETIDFMPGFEVADDEIKKYLTEASLKK